MKSKKMSLLAIAVCAVAEVSAAAQEPDFTKVEIKTQKLADGVWMLTGYGGNIGMTAGPDGVLLIDDQFAPLTKKIRAAVTTLSDRPIRFVLNTHWHFDHTGANKDFAEAGALLVAHDNVRKQMSVDHFFELFKLKVPASPLAALPVLTFDQTATLHVNGDTVHAIHVAPAHTDGDVIVQFEKANVIHTGDTFCNGFYCYVDLATGGSIDGMIAATDRVLAMSDGATRIIPGHGPLAIVSDLKSYREMLVGSRDAVRALVKAGKSTKEVLDARPTSPWDETWGAGFLKPADWVAILDADARKVSR